MDIDIRAETPGVADYLRLRREAGLSPFSPEAAEIGLKGTLFAVMLFHDGEAIGMGRVVGDGGCHVQVVDIAVMPAYQGRGLGKRIMAEIDRYLREQIPASAYVNLLADVPANKLYEQFGFRQTAPATIGMARKN